jgi:hypothetical protein
MSYPTSLKRGRATSPWITTKIDEKLF